MAIEGDLKDIGLGNIVQLFCQERRKGKLQLRQGEDGGTIFFEGGEIVHATSGELSGPEAIYKMLTWESGWFRMTDATTVKNTVNLNWNHLLLNGMRRIDEQTKHHFPILDAPAPSVSDLSQDRNLEGDLVAWFSQAEQVLDQMQTKRILKRPILAIQTLNDLLNDAISFSETHFRTAGTALSLTKALAEALEDFPQTRILFASKNRVSVKTVVNMYRNWGDDPADRLHFMRQVARGMIFTLEAYLRRITDQFSTAAKREEWSKPQEAFLIDLRRVCDHIPF